MRIALDASPLIGTRTGIGGFVAGLASRLAEETGVEVVPYTLSAAARRAGTVRGQWVPVPAVIAPALWRVARRPLIERFVGPIDVVHGTNYLVPPARVRRVVSVYDLSFLDQVHAGRVDRAVRWAVRTGATVHTMAASVADEIRTRYPSARVVVVPGAVVAQGPRRTPPEGPPVVVALGATGRRKRIPLLVESFGRAFPEGNTTLRIVGPPGDDEEAVARAVAALPDHSAGRVVRVGPVDDARRDAELQAATVLAYPSDYEGFGMPVLEAMAAGVPVVTTDGGSLPEVAGNAARVVPVGDGEALGCALAEVVASEEEQRRLVAAGLDRVELFSWERTITGMMGLYGGTE